MKSQLNYTRNCKRTAQQKLFSFCGVPLCMDEKVLCCCSGGLDSTVMMHKLRKERFAPIPCYVNYGQKTADVEIQHLKRLFSDVRVIDFDLSACIKGWATEEDNTFVPIDGTEKDLLFIPGRNIFILLRLCVMGYYEDIHYLALGNTVIDIVCGDCMPPFVNAFENALTLGMSTAEREYPVKILSPLENMTKADIVKYAVDRGVSLEDTWSCYDTQDKHCGVCWNCLDRKEAFKTVGIEDKTEYLS